MSACSASTAPSSRPACSPSWSRLRQSLLPLFPPVVTGTIIMVIGISLMRVGINWAGGGLPAFPGNINGKAVLILNANYGQLAGLGIVLFCCW